MVHQHATASAYLQRGELDPYDGPFTATDAAHLLRRATFAVTQSRIDEAVALGFDGTLDRLFAELPRSAPPVNAAETRDPNVAVGETWVDAPFLRDFDVRHYRNRSLQAWHIARYFEGGFNVRARMSFFWHNHFSVTHEGDPRIYYRYLDLIERHATGDFRALVREMSTTPAMLGFLNGKDNEAGSPNENFARELMELYTIGKGALVGPGDYTTYTEDDVRALAKALTGWQIEGRDSHEVGKLPHGAFDPARHDDTEQVLSRRMGGRLLPSAGEGNVAQVVDAIFSRPYAADQLCRKLYRFFVYYEIDETVEREVIQPMALTLRRADYDIQTVVRMLLGSRHFFDLRVRGTLIKSPLEFALDATAGLGYAPPADDLTKREGFFVYVDYACRVEQMELEKPPTVAGWKAYYQAPQWNRMWINAASLQRRTETANKATAFGFNFDGTRYPPDLLAYIASVPGVEDPNALIDAIAARWFAFPLAPAQRDALKEILLPGLPDFEWTVEYGDHRAHPEDENLETSIRNKVRDLLRAMLKSAEAHLA